MKSSSPRNLIDHGLIVVSNRQPYRHHEDACGNIHAVRCSSGVVNAVEPLLLRRSGVWIAAGDGKADRQAAINADGVEMPPRHPRYRLRRVWLSEAEVRGHCDGFANSALWPMCHRTAVPPRFYAADFGIYEIVNRRFAEAVAEEARTPSPLVFVQDYQFALAPAMIRRELPLCRLATFWHIPWPAPEVLRHCPWSQTLLDGLLGSTLIGFQTAVDRDHFRRAVERLAHVDVEDDVVRYKGRRVRLGVYPASISWPSEMALAAPPVAECRKDIRERLQVPDDIVLGVGIDRLDYSKGIAEKFLAIERLLERRADLRQRLVFAQIAEPTRERLPAYQQTRNHVLAVAERVNRRFGGGPPPIVLLPAHHDQATVARFMRAADFCYVGSLHDGMNLVSKEFVAARDDEHGVLVLSAGAGASHELREALIVNPFDVEQSALSLGAAIDMPQAQQGHRMRRLRRVIAGWDADRWAEQILLDTAEENPQLIQAQRSVNQLSRTPLSTGWRHGGAGSTLGLG
jgi:trehalose 6-phosphate synthase